MTIGILIADDQTLVRTGFRMILEAESGLRVVGEAKDGIDAVEAARRCRPDVVLMDIRMPRLDGLEATRRILADARSPDRPRILMLTTFDLDEYVLDALRAGASGFLLKDVPPEQLVAGIRGGRRRPGTARPDRHPPADRDVRRRQRARQRTPPRRARRSHRARA